MPRPHLLLPYRGRRPVFGARVFLAPGVCVAGDVELGDDVSFWFHAVARGDVNSIRVGARTNVQDGAVLHVAYRTHALRIGAGVVIGHQAVLHGCTIGDGALIGIGARVLDGAVVEAGAQVGAGAVVAPGQRVPAGQLALGVPARVVRPLTAEESCHIADTCQRYAELKEEYRAILAEVSEIGEVNEVNEVSQAGAEGPRS
ncbi:MAG TPA: gamma carbonic anhydrase family protein [Thermoanaerobaculia bacterium]|nr:gamma carbonic anhydrase family protein [Thermoanaerobaculia bacterium]